jgi:NitT/TauT family transport system permease protein
LAAQKYCSNGGDSVKRLISVANLICVLIYLLELWPSSRTDTNSGYLLILVAIIEGLFLLYSLLPKDQEKQQTTGDVLAIVYGAVFLWEMLTTKLNILDKMLFPSPGVVIALFILELPTLLTGLLSSMELLLSGFGLALITAVLLALFIGWRKRVYRAIVPVTKVLGPIPPIVYIPYAIGLLPTFKVSSAFIIFIGAFWPIFINSLNGVINVEKRLIDSAKVLNVKESTMLFKVILPGALPSIISGTTIGLVMSFILLTAAEMIGATSGLGWYVKYYSDFADYPRVIVGIIFIGIVVTGITYVFDRVERYLLRWRKVF